MAENDESNWNPKLPGHIYNDAGWLIKRPGYSQIHWNKYELAARDDIICRTCDGIGYHPEAGWECLICEGKGWHDISERDYDMYRYLTQDIEYYDE